MRCLTSANTKKKKGVVGKRMTGKSTLVKDLCCHIKDKIDFALVFVDTECDKKTLL